MMRFYVAAQHCTTAPRATPLTNNPPANVRQTRRAGPLGPRSRVGLPQPLSRPAFLAIRSRAEASRAEALDVDESRFMEIDTFLSRRLTERFAADRSSSSQRSCASR